MRITKMKTLCLSRLHEPKQQWFTAQFRAIKADCCLVVIETDEGITGVGEATPYGIPNLVRERVEVISPLMVGRDPIDSSIAPHPNGLSRTYDAAVAGIDQALWDIRGKLVGKPVCELLAEKPLHRIRLYASSGCRWDWRTPNPERQLIEEALEYFQQGFTAYKFRIGTHWGWDGVTVDRFLGVVRELHQELKGQMELMVEGNSRLTEEQALAIGKELDRLGGFNWFEEPVPRENLDTYVRLSEAIETPISAGEAYSTLEQFLPFITRRAYDITQPDVGLCGISEGLRIALLGNEQGIRTVPHNWHNLLIGVASAHLVAALPDPWLLELCMIQGPLQWQILRENPVKDGYLDIPRKPGLGVELADDLEERFPYIEGHYAIQVDRHS